MNFQMFKLDLEKAEGKRKKEKAEEPQIKFPTSMDHRKSKRIPEKQKHLLLLY